MTGVPKALVQGDGDPGSTVEWTTPDDLFDSLDAEFGPFTLDPATALGYHTSDVILERGGKVVTLDGAWVKTIEERSEQLTSGIHVEKWDTFSGLDLPWTGRVWLNHPYGRSDWRWMKKARDSVREGDADIVVALVPVKTGMRWWQLYVGSGWDNKLPRESGFGDEAVIHSRKEGAADSVRFLPGRLRFGNAKSSAPFNSAIVVWRK